MLTNTSTSVTFSCGVSGSEPIDYTWFLGNGTQIEPTNRITGSNTSMLTIDDVVSSDYGEYFCSASNAVNRQRSENALLTGLLTGSTSDQYVFVWCGCVTLYVCRHTYQCTVCMQTHLPMYCMYADTPTNVLYVCRHTYQCTVCMQTHLPLYCMYIPL